MGNIGMYVILGIVAMVAVGSVVASRRGYFNRVDTNASRPAYDCNASGDAEGKRIGAWGSGIGLPVNLPEKTKRNGRRFITYPDGSYLSESWETPHKGHKPKKIVVVRDPAAVAAASAEASGVATVRVRIVPTGDVSPKGGTELVERVEAEKPESKGKPDIAEIDRLKKRVEEAEREAEEARKAAKSGGATPADVERARREAAAEAKRAADARIRELERMLTAARDEAKKAKSKDGEDDKKDDTAKDKEEAPIAPA